jgi:acetyl esterase/lipase
VLDLPFGTHPAQRLDLYLPHRPSSEAAPIMVYLHAGGWVGGHEDDVPAFVMRFVERGYAVASVGYRLAPEFPFPKPIQDVKLSIRWLKAYGDREGVIDGDRMVLVGVSAGGHLAAFAAATAGVYEPEVAPDLAEASPIHHLHGDLPPAYWAFGSEDALVDADLQGAAMADAWAAASVAGASWLDVVDGHGHNLDETTLNQRYLETFADLAVGSGRQN